MRSIKRRGIDFWENLFTAEDAENAEVLKKWMRFISSSGKRGRGIRLGLTLDFSEIYFLKFISARSASSAVKDVFLGTL
jgi:hypothetical protein